VSWKTYAALINVALRIVKREPQPRWLGSGELPAGAIYEFLAASDIDESQ
jgi:hypothetical protein